MKTKIVFLAFSLLFCISTYAQKSDKSNPKSMGLKLEFIDHYSLYMNKRTFGKPNISALKKEDENDERNGLPPRFGYPLDANLNTTNSGVWKILSNGDRIWRLEIWCTGAISINLLYDKFWLPKGAKFHLYSRNRSQVIGGFSSANNRGTKQNPGKFTTGLLFSESIILELFEPLAVKDQSIISVDKVVYGYREINLKKMMTNEAGHGDSGPCQVNVNCSEGKNWQNEKKGVAMIIVDGMRSCSGSLINNSSNNRKPYFLTADHCIGSLDANGNTDASYYSFWWNYESSTCIQNSSDFVAKSTSGAKLIANNSATDFALFELIESPLESNIDVYFNGWNRTTNPTKGGVGIHHPNGDFKKIATHKMTPSPGQVYDSNTHWRVNWSQTTNGYSVTEEGSSGSPLFTNNKRIIGQLHGGSRKDCSDPANDPGEYGRFHVSWDGSSPQRRLKDWLDPLNTNKSYLDGIGAEPITFQNDLKIVCYDNSKVINLNNNYNQPVTWRVSYNVTVLSSNNSSIRVRAKYTNSMGNGWVKAILSNGKTLQDYFKVGGPPSSNKLKVITTGNGNYIFPGAWQELQAHGYDNIEWSFGASVMTRNSGSDSIMVYPISSGGGSISVRIRARNECGCSQWKYQYFTIYRRTSRGNFGIMH